MLTIDAALNHFRRGAFLIVVDDFDRENEGDLVIAGQLITPEKINFMAQHGRGLICAPLAPEVFDQFNIPMMVPSDRNSSAFSTAFGVSVGAKHGVSTGISAADRARTVQVLADPTGTPDELSMPGHIFPLKARPGGVLERQGHTEAAFDLTRLCGLHPVAVICEIMNPDGTMARLPQLEVFSQTHGIPIISIAELKAYRQRDQVSSLAAQQEMMTVEEVEQAQIPTKYGFFRARVFQDQEGLEHMALCMGEMATENMLVRVHSECLTGDVFGSRRCDCGEQLENSLRRIAEEGSGLVIYLRQEGRGIGLGNKIKAYALQEQGMDTVEANLHLGFPDDLRSYDIAGAILKQLGVSSIRLMTNNPKKIEDLQRYGIDVRDREPIFGTVCDDNQHYLATKQEKMGHLIDVGSFQQAKASGGPTIFQKKDKCHGTGF
jgi:3,4-dihydroxy 2-butanone 4-phosphate synthase/GTP cyclohydrolase II